MALTVNAYFTPGVFQGIDVNRSFFGVVELLGDASYPALGYPISGLSLPWPNIRLLIPLASNSGVIPVWDQVNQKVRFFFPTGGSVAAPASLATATGTGAAGATAVTSSAATVPVNLTPGVGVEVGTGTNLSTVKVYALLQASSSSSV